MIDITHKNTTLREAKAQAVLEVGSEETIKRIKEDTVPKGNVFEMSKASGLLAVKKTPLMLPDCHPLPIEATKIDYEIDGCNIIITVTVKTIYKTGVEVEAMHGAANVALCMYDMLKPLTDDLAIGEIRVIQKKGGKSDYTNKLSRVLNAAVLIISDTWEDKTGKVIQKFLQRQSINVKIHEILPGDQEKISGRLKELIDNEEIDLIFTTGGTSLGSKDITSEATWVVIDKEIPGISEAIRKYEQERTPYAMLSRGISGVRKQSLIINLPDNSTEVEESLRAIFPGLLHSFELLWDNRR